MDNLKERFLKERFFAQYWGVECAVVESYSENYKGKKTFAYNHHKVGTGLIGAISYLELKPSKSLTREEADYIKHELGKMGDVSVTAAFDYARTLGYLVPFMGMSEDDLIKKGWVKIIE